MTATAPFVFDCRGELCPLPVARARQALRRLAPGAEIELWCTDPLAGLDLAALCLRDGHCLLAESVADAHGVSRIRLRAGAAPKPL